MSRPTPPRPVPSRTATPRPRRIAGQSASARPASTGPQDLDLDEAVRDAEPGQQSAGLSLRKKPAAKQPAAKKPVDDKPVDDKPVDEHPGGPAPDGPLARPRTSRVLLTVVGALAVVLALELAIVLVASLTEPESRPAGEKPGIVEVPDDLPVVIDELQYREGVDAAAKAAQEIVAISFESYDDEVEEAAPLMTPRFEAQYRQTAEEIKADFVAAKTVVQTTVVAQGVVRANRTRLQALVFLNQVVTRTRDGEPETVVTPFKVLVTMVHTDKGWLVDQLDTNAEQDNGARQDKSN